MRKTLKKTKEQYDVFLFQNRWAEIVVGVVIIGVFVWGMWAFFSYQTNKDWVFIESSSGEVTGLRPYGSHRPVVYTLVKLDDDTNVSVFIETKYDIRKGRAIVLDKYQNQKKPYEVQYRFNFEHQNTE